MSGKKRKRKSAGSASINPIPGGKENRYAEQYPTINNARPMGRHLTRDEQTSVTELRRVVRGGDDAMLAVFPCFAGFVSNTAERQY